MNNSIAAVLFDIDGTLLDTAFELYTSTKNVLDSMQRPCITFDDFRPCVSRGSKAMLKAAFDIDESHPEFESIRLRLLTDYEKNIGHNTEGFAGMLELLAFLSENNKPWGIVTNKPRRFTTDLLGKFPILEQSAITICPDDLTQPKPAPEGLLLACDKLSITPENAIYIGDSIFDVNAAKAANMPVAIAKYGYFAPNEDILAWNADYYFADGQDLQSHLATKLA